MNDTLLRMLYFFKANFWDRQFYVFLIFSVLIFCLIFLKRRGNFDTSPLVDFLAEKTRRDSRNCFYIVAAGILLCVSIFAITGFYAPQTHDEFGYLLAAD